MSDFLCDYPYEDETPDGIVANWCTYGHYPGEQHHAIMSLREWPKDKQLATAIKANWRVKATLAELTEASRVYRDKINGAH